MPNISAAHRAYEDYKQGGGTGPDGKQLPEWRDADAATKRHVAEAVAAAQPPPPMQQR